MGFSLTSPAPEKCDPTAKNRVWGFFGEQPETSRPNRPQSLQPRRENRPTTTKVASGRAYWPSRDPIGEEGGINLYGMVGNDVVGGVDYFGLMASRPRLPNGVTDDDFSVYEDSCEIILTVFISFKFINHKGSPWTEDRKKKFMADFYTGIMNLFNENKFLIKPKNKTWKEKRDQSWWDEFCNGPKYNEKPCPCPNGFKPKVSVVTYEGKSRIDDFFAEVKSMVPGEMERSSAHPGGPGLFLDENDNLLVNKGGASPQNPSAHEFGHVLGLHHPGRGVTPRNSEYQHIGRDEDGNFVDGSQDLMGIGNGLRPFYFQKWADHLNGKYPKCEYSVQ